MAVIAKNASAADFPKIEYILRDLSNTAPVQRILFLRILELVKCVCFYCVRDIMPNIHLIKCLKCLIGL